MTALRALHRQVDFRWLSAAVTPGDREIERERARCGNDRLAFNPSCDRGARRAGESSGNVDFVAIPENVFHKHYGVFSNRFLWFLQHSMWNLLQDPKDKNTIGNAWWDGYVPANRAFARAVKAVAKGCRNPVIMLHDYHLYLAPHYIRQEHSNAILQHFIHIPWPSPDVWRALPTFLCMEICRSLLANDIVGFQTSAFAQNFLRCCDVFLDRAEVDYAGQMVIYGGRKTQVRVYPISVDVNELRQALDSPATKEYQRRLRQVRGELTLARVDRLEPSKNIGRGLLAFERLLDRRPELKGRAKLLAFLVPSRTDIAEYKQCFRDVMGLTDRINSRYGGGGFLPVEIFYENNYLQALAGMSICDVLIVNPLADGMNLVAKEGPIVSTRDSVLVLARTAGAYNQLRDGVIGVEPNDMDGTAKALEQAVEMGPDERRKRSLYLRDRIEKEDVSYWMRIQLEDIEMLRADRPSPAASRLRPPLRRESAADLSYRIGVS